MIGQRLREGRSNGLAEPHGATSEIQFRGDRSVKVKYPLMIFAFRTTNLHDYGNAGIVEDLRGELGMPESLSLVPRE